MGTESGHEVPAPWNDGLKVMFYEVGQEIYDLKGLALANTIQHTKTANVPSSTERGNGRKKKRRGGGFMKNQSELNLISFGLVQQNPLKHVKIG